MTEAAVLEDTPCTPLPATTAVHAALLPMDTVIIPHAMIPTGIVTPHPTLTTSPVGATHATTQTGPVSLQQLPLHITGISAQKSQAMPKTLNPP